MSDASAFSPDYGAARARFQSGALAKGFQVEALPLVEKGPDGQDLAIEVARFGEERPTRAVVVSSGTHGVEGYVGSAIQAALLEDELGGWEPPPGGALIFLHAVNPYGFAWTRRVNESNVDQNRNFLRPGEAYSGSPAGYAELDGLLNPTHPPRTLEPFRLRALWHIARHGMPVLKNAVVGGQYDFPKGLFFGGSAPSTSYRLLDEALPRYVGACSRVVHVDFHSGLGKSATYKLLVDHPWGSDGAKKLGQRFGDDLVQPWEPEKGVSYQIRGGLGSWAKAKFPRCDYDVLVAEFGTYGALSVISALRDENCAHHWAPPGSAITKRAKETLQEIFNPRESAWRDAVVPQGVQVVRQAMAEVFGE